jgi:hypothetical protein
MSEIIESSRTTSLLTIIFVAVFIVFLYYLANSIEEGFQEYFGSGCVDFIPFKKEPVYPTKKGTIFISIASYRDSECSMTIETIFKNATNPENVFTLTLPRHPSPHLQVGV